MNKLIVHIDTPYMTAQQYAERVGLTPDSVRSKINLGHIPTVKQGRSRLVNFALLMKEALEAEDWRDE